jgi:hypothetical protein
MARAVDPAQEGHTMKKAAKTKQLKLTRDTMRALSDPALRAAHGGYYTGPQPTQICTNPYVDKNCSGWTLDCWSGGGHC